MLKLSTMINVYGNQRAFFLYSEKKKELKNSFE